jgi:hypothetical protein
MVLDQLTMYGRDAEKIVPWLWDFDEFVKVYYNVL